MKYEDYVRLVDESRNAILNETKKSKQVGVVINNKVLSENEVS